MSPELNWNEIDTVLFDMDGTLIDLEFDNYFWQQLVPEQLHQQHGMPLETAREWIPRQYGDVRNTLNWYSLEFWSEQLSLDICGMTSAVGHRARLRDDCPQFLQALRQSGRQAILLTNAHPHSLAVKVKHTGLDKHLDSLLSTHTFGYPKEDLKLWDAVQKRTGLDPKRTLFIDDVEDILAVAKNFGISYCLGVNNPDSSTAKKTFRQFPSLGDFRTLMPGL